MYVNVKFIIRHEVLTTVNAKIAIFWGVMPCGLEGTSAPIFRVHWVANLHNIKSDFS
jgi:hypothetical protein